MKLCKPYKSCTPQKMTQGFNPQHRANDWAGSYGEDLVAPFNGKVASIITAENIDTGEELLYGYGIRIISAEDPSFYLSYWHCLPFFGVDVGDYVNMGQPIAEMGNSGFVFSGGKYVDIDIRTIPPYPGTHAHISCGKKNDDGSYTEMDYSTLIDWSIPINYDAKTFIWAILKKIMNFLKGRK